MIEGLVLGLHLLSYHTPVNDAHNNVNPGIYAKTQEGWTAGIYENTWKRTSVYLGKTWSYEFQDGDLSFLAGGVTGYKARRKDIDCPTMQRRYHKPYVQGATCYEIQGFSKHDVSLLVAPSVRYQLLRLTVLPRIGKNPQVRHLSIEKAF